MRNLRIVPRKSTRYDVVIGGERFALDRVKEAMQRIRTKGTTDQDDPDLDIIRALEHIHGLFDSCFSQRGNTFYLTEMFHSVLSHLESVEEEEDQKEGRWSVEIRVHEAGDVHEVELDYGPGKMDIEQRPGFWGAVCATADATGLHAIKAFFVRKGADKHQIKHGGQREEVPVMTLDQVEGDLIIFLVDVSQP